MNIFKKPLAILILLLGYVPFEADPYKIYEPRSGKPDRISSYDTKRGNDDFVMIPKNTSVVIAEKIGSGMITHIWMTLSSKDPMIKRNAVIKIYWDGLEFPSVEVPIGDFFGQGFGEEYLVNSQYIVAAPKKGKSWNSYFAMPFSKGFKIVIDNQSDMDIPNLYFYIDFEVYGKKPSSELRFHSFWNRSLTEPASADQRENEWALLGPTQPGQDSDKGNFVILDTKGKGQFVGLHLFVDSPTPMWYGEGDDMIFIDGKKWPPDLHGTGTEDIFNMAWSPKEVFMHPLFGSPKVSDSAGWLGRTHLYRFWAESPIAYEKSFTFSIEHGHANNLTLDLISVAYFYQVPSSPLPELPTKMFRQNKPEITFRELHKWRDSYKKEKRDRVWGNE